MVLRRGQVIFFTDPGTFLAFLSHPDVPHPNDGLQLVRYNFTTKQVTPQAVAFVDN